MSTTALATPNAAVTPRKRDRHRGGKLRLKTLDHIDKRTMAAIRTRELIAAIENDLGGTEHLTECTKQLVQRAALLSALIESNEAAWLSGNAVDLATYFTAVNSQRRILVTLGLERRSRDVTPDLQDYLAQHPAATEDPADVEVEETSP
jgi:hypothetical protein